MSSGSKRSERRQRHNGPHVERSSDHGVTQFASVGEERSSLPDAPRESSTPENNNRDPRTLNDIDPRYGHTHGTSEQRKGGVETVAKDTYGRGGQELNDPEGNLNRNGEGGGPTGFGEVYGQGFGVGAGHGAVSASSGLEGSPRERDYRGAAGTTFGATVGPDALKADTSQDKRDDPKPNP